MGVFGKFTLVALILTIIFSAGDALASPASGCKMVLALGKETLQSGTEMLGPKIATEMKKDSSTRLSFLLIPAEGEIRRYYLDLEELFRKRKMRRKIDEDICEKTVCRMASYAI